MRRTRWFLVSATRTPPCASNAPPRGQLKLVAAASPSAAPLAQLPASVLTALERGLTARIRLLFTSATRRWPVVGSRARPFAVARERRDGARRRDNADAVAGVLSHGGRLLKSEPHNLKPAPLPLSPLAGS